MIEYVIIQLDVFNKHFVISLLSDEKKKKSEKEAIDSTVCFLLVA